MPQGALELEWPFKTGAWAGFIPPMDHWPQAALEGAMGLGEVALFRAGQVLLMQLPATGRQHSQQWVVSAPS